MDPPNASSDSQSQLEVTQVTEQLSTMPETQQLASNPTPSYERIIQNHAFLTAPEIGPASGDQTTPTQLSYLSGTTVENTPGVYQDIPMGLRHAGTPDNPTVNGGWREEERYPVLSGIPSSSPPFSTLPGFHSHREERGDMEKALGCGDEEEEDQVEREGNGEELPLSPQSGLRGGFSAERGSIEIPDSEGIEEDEFPDGPGPETPRRIGGVGEEETVVDTPFVELVASTDGVTGFTERGDLVEGALLTSETQEETQKGAANILDEGQERSIQITDTKETNSEIPQKSQESAIQNTNTRDVATVGGSQESNIQATDTKDGASEIEEESQGHAIQSTDTKESEPAILEESLEPAIQTTDDVSELSRVSQELAIQTVDTKDGPSVILDDSQEPMIQSTKEMEFGVLGSPEPAMLTISDSSGQVSETTKDIPEVTGAVDSPKDRLSEIVCQTLFISPDEHPENSLVNSTAEEEIDSIGIEISTPNPKHTPIIENEIPKEKLHSGATEATIIENSEPDDFGYLDPSVTMELPIVMYLSDEDVHTKVSSDIETPITNAGHAGIETPSSEKLDPDVIDPLENDVIPHDLEAGSTKSSSEMLSEIGTSSLEIFLQATMHPPHDPTNVGVTKGEDDKETDTEMRAHEPKNPPATALLTTENLVVQDQEGESKDKLGREEQEILTEGVNSPIAALLPQEVTVLEDLGMGTRDGVHSTESPAEVEKPRSIKDQPATVPSLEPGTGTGETHSEKEDDLLSPSKEEENSEDELTLPAGIASTSENVLEDIGSEFTTGLSHTTRRTEIPDSDISLEDAASIVEEQDLAVKGTGDGVTGPGEMDDANNAMEDGIGVTTSLKELENDGCNEQSNDLNEIPDQDGGFITKKPAAKGKIQTKPKNTEPNLEKDREAAKNINSTGNILDEKAPVPVLAMEATVTTQSSDSLTQPKEGLAQPSGLILPDKATSLDFTHAGEELKSVLPPTSLPAQRFAIQPTAYQIFQPGTRKLQVQGSESVKARPNQEPKENITTCKVIVIPASSESQLTDPPSSSSSSSIQQPSTVADIPPSVPISSKPKTNKKRVALLAIKELSSPSKTDIPSSPPRKKSRVEDARIEDASPGKGTEEEQNSPVKNKDEILMDELKAMKVASIQSRNANLELEISRIKAKLEAVKTELKHPASETVKTHIHLLHQYNDIRDVGQGLIGMIAENRGVRIGELYEEFGVGLKD